MMERKERKPVLLGDDDAIALAQAPRGRTRWTYGWLFFEDGKSAIAIAIAG